MERRPRQREDAANGLRCPAIGEGVLLEEGAERFQTRAIDIGQEATERWRDGEDSGVQTEP